MKNPPTFEIFKEYANQQIQRIGDDPELYTEWIQIKFMTWESDDWHKNPKGKRVPIKNWKTTLISCLPYREFNKAKPKTATLTATQMLRRKHGLA